MIPDQLCSVAKHGLAGSGAGTRPLPAVETRASGAHGVSYSIGIVLLQRGDFEEAQDRFLQAVGEFDYAPAYNNLGTVYLRQDVVSEAIYAYRQAVALDGSNAAHHYNLGLALQKDGQNGEAIEAFERAIALDASHTKAYLSKALSFQRIGELSQARTALENLLRIDPSNSVATRLLQRM